MLARLGFLIVVIALAGSALFGLFTTYVIAAIIVLCLIVQVWRGQAPWPKSHDELLFVSVFALLLVDFVISAGLSAGAASAFNFLAFLLYVPAARAIDAAKRHDGTVVMATLALIGTALALIICTVQYFGLRIDRPPGIASDTIRLANTAVIMGFLSLTGFVQYNRRARYVFLLGPVLAVGVVVFTGTRIAMAAFPLALFVCVLMLAPRRWRLSMVAGAVASSAALVAILWQTRNARFLSMVDAVQQAAAGNSITDIAIKTRLNLYEAAWTAFQASPLVGYGWSNMMRVTIPLMPDAQEYAVGLPHLHNELLSLAVSAGLAGVIVYAVLLIAPLVLVLRSPPDPQRSGRVFAMTTVVSCYALMGLTDTMLTFEMHTMLYVVLCATILRLCRNPQAGVGES